MKCTVRGTKEHAKRQKPKTPSGTQPAGNVPEGAGQPAAEPETTKRTGDGKGKGTGRGQPKGKAQPKKKAKGPGKCTVPDYDSDAKSDVSDKKSDAGSSKSSAKGGGGKPLCTFFKNGTGCNKGATCEFKHGQFRPQGGQ